MYLGEATTYTQAQRDNILAWMAVQPPDKFIMPGLETTTGEWWKNQGFSKEALQQIADNALAQGEFQKSVGFNPNDVTPWENPNWPAVEAAKAAERERQRLEAEAYAKLHPEITAGPGPGDNVRTNVITTPSRTVTPAVTSTPATRPQVVAAFRSTPGANPEPDEAAITYYMGKGVAQLVADVAAIRKANPALAAQIDARRRALGLTTGAAITTVVPSQTSSGGGGYLPLILAAAAAYFLGS